MKEKQSGNTLKGNDGGITGSGNACNAQRQTAKEYVGALKRFNLQNSEGKMVTLAVRCEREFTQAMRPTGACPAGSRAIVIFSRGSRIIFYDNFLKYFPPLDFMTDLSGWNPEGWKKGKPHPRGSLQVFPSQEMWKPLPGTKYPRIGPARSTVSVLPRQGLPGSLCRKEWKYTQKPLPLVFGFIQAKSPSRSDEIQKVPYRKSTHFALCPLLFTDCISKWGNWNSVLGCLYSPPRLYSSTGVVNTLHVKSIKKKINHRHTTVWLRKFLVTGSCLPMKLRSEWGKEPGLGHLGLRFQSEAAQGQKSCQWA